MGVPGIRLGYVVTGLDIDSAFQGGDNPPWHMSQEKGRVHALNYVPVKLGEGKTLPQVFRCSDEHLWVLKLPGSPGAAPWELCADWIGSALAALARLPVVECGLVQCGLTALWTLPHELARWAKPGTAFGTVYLEQAREVTGSIVVERGLALLDLMRIVAMDTWLDVLDRQKPHRGGWNLLEDTSGPEPRVVAIDYGKGLADVFGVLLETPQMRIQAPPEWLPLLRQEDIDLVVGEIAAISPEQIAAIVGAVPADWRTAVAAVDKVPACLLQRREALATCLREGLRP